MTFDRQILTVFGISIAFMASTACAVNIAGSDLLGDGVEAAISGQLAGMGIDTELALDGSLLGIDSFKKGDADVLIIASPEGFPTGLSSRIYPFGFQVVAFLAHSTNPVSELSYQQLGNLYRNSGTIDNWSQLTGDPAWQDRNLELFATRSDRAMTLEIFNSVILEGEGMKDSVRFLPADPEAILLAIAEEPSVIVIAPTMNLDSSARYLAIKKSGTEQAFTPSDDNVFYGDYPLSLPFFIVIGDNVDDESVNSVMKALYSESVTSALRGSFYLPVPESERSAVLLQFD